MSRYTPGREGGSADTPPVRGRRPGRPTRRKPQTAYVSLYAPTGRRKWWWYSYRCPECGAYQLGRARQLDHVTGIRKAGCGHLVEIVIARTYGRPEAA
jgi:hypothetical protein